MSPEGGIMASWGTEMGLTSKSHTQRPLKPFLWRNGVISAPFMVEVSSLSNWTETDKAG